MFHLYLLLLMVIRSNLIQLMCLYYFFKQETGKCFFKRTDPVEFSFDLKVVGSEDEKRVEVTFLINT